MSRGKLESTYQRFIILTARQKLVINHHGVTERARGRRLFVASDIYSADVEKVN